MLTKMIPPLIPTFNLPQQDVRHIWESIFKILFQGSLNNQPVTHSSTRSLLAQFACLILGMQLLMRPSFTISIREISFWNFILVKLWCSVHAIICHCNNTMPHIWLSSPLVYWDKDILSSVGLIYRRFLMSLSVCILYLFSNKAFQCQTSWGKLEIKPNRSHQEKKGKII